MESSRTAYSITKILDPENQKKYFQVKKIIEDVFRLWGFDMITTPIIADVSTLLAKFAGDEIGQQILRIEETNLALRFDQTVPLCEYLGRNLNKINLPLKRFSVGTSFRREYRGRLWEFDQADCDIITENDSKGFMEIEILGVLSDILERLGLDYKIRINDLDLLKGILLNFGIPENTWNPVLRVIDKISKTSRQQIISELLAVGVSEIKAEQLLSFIAAEAKSTSDFDRLGMQDRNFQNSILRMSELLAMVDRVGLKNIVLDLSIVRGLNYYSGFVMEAFLSGKQAIVGGGEYGNLENLSGNENLRNLKGIGFGIGLTRLITLMEKSSDASLSVLIVPILADGEKCMYKAMEIGDLLRRNGINARLYTEKKNLKKVFRYADREKFKQVVLIGGDELSEDRFTLKNMASDADQKQLSLNLNELVERLKK